MVGLGLAGPALPRASGTDETIVDRCAGFAGTDFSPAEAHQMLGKLDEMLDRLRLLRGQHPDNALAPAETFDPRPPGWRPRPLALPAAVPPEPPVLPRDPADIAFAPAWMQAGWLRQGHLLYSINAQNSGPRATGPPSSA